MESGGMAVTDGHKEFDTVLDEIVPVIVYKRGNPDHNICSCTDNDRLSNKYDYYSKSLQIKNQHSYKCPNCNKTFPELIHLKLHIVRYHVGATPYKCLEVGCEASFAVKETLQKHTSAVHSELIPYKCKQCLAKFKFLNNLLKHIRCKHPHNKQYALNVSSSVPHQRQTSDNKCNKMIFNKNEPSFQVGRDGDAQQNNAKNVHTMLLDERCKDRVLSTIKQRQHTLNIPQYSSLPSYENIESCLLRRKNINGTIMSQTRSDKYSLEQMSNVNHCSKHDTSSKTVASNNGLQQSKTCISGTPVHLRKSASDAKKISSHSRKICSADLQQRILSNHLKLGHRRGMLKNSHQKHAPMQKENDDKLNLLSTVMRRRPSHSRSKDIPYKSPTHKYSRDLNCINMPITLSATPGNKKVPFHCADCNTEFYLCSQLLSHIRHSHTKRNSSKVYTPKSFSDNKSRISKNTDRGYKLWKAPYRCEKCNKEYKCHRSYVKHVKHTHSSASPQHVPTAKRNCQKRQRSASNFLAHKNVLHRCKQCNSTYKETKDLLKHVKFIHGAKIRHNLNLSPIQHGIRKTCSIQAVPNQHGQLKNVDDKTCTDLLTTFAHTTKTTKPGKNNIATMTVALDNVLSQPVNHNEESESCKELPEDEQISPRIENAFKFDTSAFDVMKSPSYNSNHQGSEDTLLPKQWHQEKYSLIPKQVHSTEGCSQMNRWQEQFESPCHPYDSLQRQQYEVRFMHCPKLLKHTTWLHRHDKPYKLDLPLGWFKNTSGDKEVQNPRRLEICNVKQTWSSQEKYNAE